MQNCKYSQTVTMPLENGAGSAPMDSEDHRRRRHRHLLVCLDVFCLFIASIPFFACEMGAVEPYKRGFFCHDESISYPYEENESISDGVLISGGILITAVSIALGESYRVHYLKVESKAFVSNHYISTLYKEIGSFLFGCTVGQSLTNMAKLTIGRLRPNFLTVCKPLVNCSIGQYVDNYSCTGNASLEKEARKSFYSGHASFAMYTMLYLAFYLQARFTWHGARLLRPLVQFLLVMLALYTGLTRISDYKHHPSDVLVGFVQGALVAIWVALYISPMFKKKERCQGKTGNILDSPVSSQHTVC
ncbi:phosphatidic acid phosphatase type 2D [Polypterus senegalus]|uniref:phosphatidic acid phosphatase type 2D n=1 Tax=Polypterus senegalus TaxID=55291 RepID=UPI001964F548|nr:phosphatidic acid phosphatase type 2D [Polypterus senegalus]